MGEEISGQARPGQAQGPGTGEGMAREEALGPGGERVYCRPQGVWWCLCLEEGLRKASRKVRSQGLRSWDRGFGLHPEEADVEKRPSSLGSWTFRNKPQSCGVVKEVQGCRKAFGEVGVGHPS